MATRVHRESTQSNEPGSCHRKLRPVVAAIFQHDGDEAIAALARIDRDELEKIAPCSVSRGLLVALRDAGPSLQRWVLIAVNAWVKEYVPTLATSVGPGRVDLPEWLYDRSSSRPIEDQRARDERAAFAVEPRVTQSRSRVNAAIELLQRLGAHLSRAEAINLDSNATALSLVQYANRTADAVLQMKPGAVVLQWVMNASERTYESASAAQWFASLLRDVVSPNPRSVDIVEVAKLFDSAAKAWAKRSAKTHGAYDKLNRLVAALGIPQKITPQNVTKWSEKMVVVDAAKLARL